VLLPQKRVVNGWDAIRAVLYPLPTKRRGAFRSPFSHTTAAEDIASAALKNPDWKLYVLPGYFDTTR
jgi:hypothetical protein